MYCILQVETIMNGCWAPLPEQRLKPQSIMRDMNQILYRVSTHSRNFCFSSVLVFYHMVFYIDYLGCSLFFKTCDRPTDEQILLIIN
mgnify:CR=1 FL=1